MAKNAQPQLVQQTSFEVFRYQLVVDKTLPINMFEKYETAEQVRADKNNILQRVITGDEFHFQRWNIRTYIKVYVHRWNNELL